MKISYNARISLALAVTALLFFGVAPVRGQVQEAPGVFLPVATTSTNVTSITVPVITTEIDEDDRITYFEGQFTYDSTKIFIPTGAATNAGLTAETDKFTVYGANFGGGTIKTFWFYVVSQGYDDIFLHGSGTLINITINIVTSTGGHTDLTWDTSNPILGYWFNGTEDAYPTELNPGSITVLCPNYPYCSR